MSNSIVRTDRWLLAPTPEQVKHLERTEKMYRSYARALVGVVFTHFNQIVNSDSPCAELSDSSMPPKTIPILAISTLGGISISFRPTCAEQLSKLPSGKLYKGFCKSIYRKAHNINRHICQLVSRQLVDWAMTQGASVIVLENLKGWRPKGGKKGSVLRQRFHGEYSQAES